MRIFVTVGTTKFDPLIDSILSEDVQSALYEKNFTQMVVQFGKSDIKDFPESKLVLLERFSFKKDLKKDIDSADLVIGHAGAGTCLEGKNHIFFNTFKFML